jgi:8-oxo-dGTP pyrophosphatase MutT (NUDIX family)
VSPSPAATLVLLRDRPAGGFELLLIRRHAKSRFAAGDFVFPGGRLEADDNPTDAAASCAGLTTDDAARVLGLAPDDPAALGYWIGAIRETFEEVGILLAYAADGGPAVLAPAVREDYRRACHQDNRAFWEMVRAERLTLATDRLVYFAHWITPEENPLRFDTRFFAAPTMDGQEAAADEREITEVRWLSPGEALAAAREGRLSLRLPTIQNLRLLDEATSVAQALAGLRGRAVRPIRPRVILEDGKRRVLLPGDPGYF